MRVRLLLFGVLREEFGWPERDLELSPGSTSTDIIETLRRGASPALDRLWSSVAIAVNQTYAGPGAPLSDGDEVALLPPVSGGAVRFV